MEATAEGNPRGRAKSGALHAQKWLRMEGGQAGMNLIEAEAEPKSHRKAQHGKGASRVQTRLALVGSHLTSVWNVLGVLERVESGVEMGGLAGSAI